MDAVVIGGGISGLSAAHALVRRGFDVQLLERQTRCGGAAISERFGGFLMEHGPSSISTTGDDICKILQIKGLKAEKCHLKPDVRYRYLLKNGRLSPIATHPFGFLTSSYLSPRARVRLLGEVLRPRGEPSGESVAQFCDRRFGAEFTHAVIDPLVAGLFGARAGEISLNSVFPALAEMEKRYGSLTRAVLTRKIAGGKMPAKRLFSWKKGVAALPRALTGQMMGHIKTGVTVRSVQAVSGGFCVDTGREGKIYTRSVILATQPHATASMTEMLDEGAASALYDIPAPPISVVYLGYRRKQVEHNLDGIGYLSPEREGRIASGALFPSSMFAGRAPQGHVAFSVYIGGSRAPAAARAPAAELVAMARAELLQTVGASGEPVVARVRQWARGLPQLPPGHEKCLETLGRAEKTCPGLFFTGNYFTGPGMARCVSQSVRVASRAATFLEHSRSFSGAAKSRYYL